MRLKITLSAEKGNLISYNYHYHLSSAIYRLLQFGSEEFSAFLHDTGFRLNGKTYKLFTFSLRFEKYTNLKNAIRLDDPKAYLYISSPLIDDFIKNFVIGTFERQEIDLTEMNFPLKFRINFVESLPQPEIRDRMKFLMMSPMILSTVKAHNGKLSQYYLRPEDRDEINRVLRMNLSNKYNAIYNREPEGGIALEFDEEYTGKSKRITKKVTINQHGKNPVDVVGVMAPFTISGSPELIRTGYECGFGEKNSMGFGMADTYFTN